MKGAGLSFFEMFRAARTGGRGRSGKFRKYCRMARYSVIFRRRRRIHYKKTGRAEDEKGTAWKGMRDFGPDLGQGVDAGGLYRRYRRDRAGCGKTFRRQQEHGT